MTASVVFWSEFLATDPKVPGSIPGASRFSERQWVWNGVHSVSWGQLRSYLEEIVAAPVKKTETNDRGIRCADHAIPSIRKSWHYFSNKRRSLGRHSSIADRSHGVFLMELIISLNTIRYLLRLQADYKRVNLHVYIYIHTHIHIREDRRVEVCGRYHVQANRDKLYSVVLKGPFFSQLSLFWKKNRRLMRPRYCLCVRVCVCVSPLSLLGNGLVNISLSLLGNGSVETLPR
jgi:hypothetical protein